MDEFTKLLVSPLWWLSVVVVGILINLASAYLKPRLDETFSRSSLWWRNRSEEAKRRDRLVAEGLAVDQVALSMFMHLITNFRIFGVTLSVFAALFLVAYDVSRSFADVPKWAAAIPLGMAAISIIAGMFAFSYSNRQEKLLFAASRLLRERAGQASQQ